MVNKEVTKNGYKCHLVCSPETKKLIMEDCVEEFLEHHPEFEGMNITHNFILKKIGDFYLNQ